jgi:uncharacterized protein YycO
MKKSNFLGYVKFSLLAILLTLIGSANGVNQLNRSPNFQFQVGDLLFQDLNCGILCNGIGEVTYGINNTYISHVGMIVKIDHNKPIVIEAISKGVTETPLTVFITRSLDKHQRPRVIVARLKKSYQHLIPVAVKYAKAQLGKPYNATFTANQGKSYYCSELIYAAFRYANNNRSIFQLNKMSFRNPATHKTTAAWTEYFAALKATPPEGMLGTNPGMMSRESAIEILYQYGGIRTHHQSYPN